MSRQVDKSNDLKKIIGNNIAELRKDIGITQRQLSLKVNTCLSTVSHWEQGGTPPSVDMLNNLADFFEVPTDFILGRCDNRIEYKKMNNIISGDITIGQMVNLIDSLSQEQKEYLITTIQMLAALRKK